MDRMRTVLCAAVFGLLYILAMAFALYFTADTSLFSYTMDWERCEIVAQNGQARAFDAAYTVPTLRAGEIFRFTGRLPDAGEAPDIYEPGSYLLTEIDGDITIELDGTEVYRFTAADHGQLTGSDQVHLGLTEQDAGKALVLLYAPAGSPSGLFPPYLRFTSENRIERVRAAVIHSYAIPVGAYILAFLVVAAIFLVGLAVGTPDWSLPVLALAETAAAACLMLRGAGTYFLPKALLPLADMSYTALVPIALMLLYLSLNRRRRFWRYLGRITVCFAAALAAGALFSALTGGVLHTFLWQLGTRIMDGYYDGLLKWGLTYLVAACSAIAAYGLLQTQIGAQKERLALALQNELMLKNYEQAQRSMQNTALMRHEWKNSIASLALMAEQGDLDQLKAKLDQLGNQLSRLSAKSYSHHTAIDTILRSAAARAEEQGIRFAASAPVPTQLSIDTSDLCSFLLNLLDNAIEAAAQAAPGQREIECSIRCSHGYLAVQCENTYAGDLRLDENGMPITTKADREGNGFGLRLMRHIAKKYNGMFDVSHTDTRFIVNAAFRLR